MYNVLLYSQNKDGEYVLSNESNVKTLRKGDNLFRDAQFTTWKTPLDYLTSGVSMFYNSALTEWKTDLPNLLNGENMFTYSNITSFNSSLPLLDNGTKMLANTPLAFFSEDMPFLTNGSYMFQNSRIQHYSSYTKRLTNAQGMFKGCTNLSEFIGSLESLENGEEMFSGCVLNATSVAFIADTIKKYSKKNITHYIDISIDCSDNFTAITKFAKDAGYTTWADLVGAFTNKGWGVNFHARGKLIESDKINISRTFDLSTFPRVGDTSASLNGSFTVSVYGSKATNCKVTIRTNDIVLDAQPLSGSSETVIYVYVNEEGQIVNPGKFDLSFASFTDTNMYLISGSFEISGNAFGISIPPNPIEVNITGDFVSIDYNNDGQVAGYNLRNLEIGDTLFKNYTDITTFRDSLDSLITAEDMFNSCTNLVSFESNNVSNLTDANNMFYNCTSLKTVNGDFSKLSNGRYMFYNCQLDLPSCNMNFPSLVDGTYMFQGTRGGNFTLNFPLLTKAGHMFYNNYFNSVTSQFPALEDGSYMFYCSSSIKTYNLKLPNLKNGSYMFTPSSYSTSSKYSSLTSFTAEMPKLEKGNYMFRNCGYLNSFNVDTLENLKTGNYMFYGTYSLNDFSYDLPNLTDGQNMFYRSYKQSNNLVIKDGLNLDSLTNGSSMFYNTGLTNFSSSLPSLTNGSSMFYGCTLNRESVEFLINDLKTKNNLKTSGVLTIGTSKEYQSDQEFREMLGETATQRDNQPGEKYPNDYPQYMNTSIKSLGGGTWKITTYWY